MTSKEYRIDELLKAFQELGQTYTRTIAAEAFVKCQEGWSIGMHPEAVKADAVGHCKVLYEISTEKLNAERATILKEILALYAPKPVGWFDACN